MSRVTSAILMLYFPDDELQARACEPLPFDERDQAFKRVDVATESGGRKVPVVYVYAAGLSHVQPEQLERWFFELPWGYMEHSGTLSWSREGEIGAVGVTEEGRRLSLGGQG